MLSDHPMYTSIPGSDLQSARSWYLDKLGFKPAEEPPLPHGDEGVFFEAGAGTCFYLYPTREGAGAGHTVAEFTGPQGHPAAWLKDCEGNILAIGSYGGR